MYDNGQGTEKDVNSAIKWYKKAANQNNSTAIYNLGVIYYNGQGIEKDYNKAFEYVKIAAGEGHSGAQNRLGYMYDNGQGIEEDVNSAIKWYKKWQTKIIVLQFIIWESSIAMVKESRKITAKQLSISKSHLEKVTVTPKIYLE
jgi:alpha/beta superfamily hydrolase